LLKRKRDNICKNEEWQPMTHVCTFKCSSLWVCAQSYTWTA